MAETKKSKDAFHGFNPYDRPITEKGEIPSCFEFRKWAEFIDIQRLQMYRDMMTELRKSTGSAEFCKNSFEDFLAISKFREAAIKTCQDTLRDEIQWQKEHFSGNVMRYGPIRRHQVLVNHTWEIEQVIRSNVEDLFKSKCNLARENFVPSKPNPKQTQTQTKK